MEERLWDPMLSFSMIKLSEKEYQKEHAPIKFDFENSRKPENNKRTKKKKEAAGDTVKEKLGTLKDLANKDQVLENAAQMLGESIRMQMTLRSGIL